MEAENVVAATEEQSHAEVSNSLCGVDLGGALHEMTSMDSLDFDSWASLIVEIEQRHADNIKMISLAYDSFLLKFPLCHWYWAKYAYHKARLCTVSEAVEIFERAVESATFSVGFWLSYCAFSESFLKEPSDIRRVYERGLSYVEKDYNCHVLWDKYLQFEFSQQQWGIIAHIYIQILRFPTKKLHVYYDHFQKFVTILEDEIKDQTNCSIESDPEDIPSDAVKMSKDEISQIIKDLQDLSHQSLRSRALPKYKTVGDQFYKKSRQLDEKINIYEAKIKTHYFQVRPIDDDEINNWHQYLDFIEKQEDFDWVLKLYERCIISCAKYPEFWMRYVEFMETKRGRPLAIFALDRASKIFHKNIPEILLFGARFKEQIGDADGARNAYKSLMDSDAFIENAIRQANLEKRLGNLVAASRICEKALETAAEQQKIHHLPNLYINFSRLKYTITGSVDAAIDVIVNGIQQVPGCRLLFEELIKFAMTHEGARQISVIDSLVAKAISPGSDASSEFDTKDKVDISCLYLEFVDLCGTIEDIRKGWNRHFKLFPQFLRPSYNDPAPSDQWMKEIMKQRLSNLVQIPVQELSPHINDSRQIDQVSVDQSLRQEDGDDSHEGRPCLPPDVAVQTIENLVEVDELNQDQVDENGIGSPAAMESTPDLVQLEREAESTSTVITQDLVHQHRENAPGPKDSTYEFVQLSESISEPLQELPYLSENHHDQGKKLEHDLKMASFENLSLKSQDKEPQELVNMRFHDNFATQVSSTNKEQRPADSWNGKPGTSDCTNIRGSILSDSRHESHENQRDGPLSPGSQENHTSEQNPPNPSASPSTSESSHLIDHSVRVSRGTSGNHADPYAQRHQALKSSYQERHVTLESGLEMERNRGSSHRNLASAQGSYGQVQYRSGSAPGNTAKNHEWPENGLPQQNVPSASQTQLSSPSANNPQPNMPQQTSESGQQTGQLPHNQAYDQMLQYQYQQQYIQYQQQMLQLHQQYAQQQNQQPYQQQQLQPQQEQQLSPLMQQQQLVQLQQQQFQSLPYHLQQQQMAYWQQYQLQQYQQAKELGYHMHQSGYQQQTDQGYQLLLQQYQLQQQGYYQMQQQQWGGHHQMPQEEEKHQPDQHQQQWEGYHQMPQEDRPQPDQQQKDDE